MSHSRSNMNYEDDASVLSNFNRGNGSIITQRQVLRACKARGWTMHPSALSLILEAVTSDAGRGPPGQPNENASTTILSEYLDRLQPHMLRSRSTLITANIWKELMDESVAAAHNPKKPVRHQSTTTPIIQVISAFDTPKLLYDITRQQFQVVPANKTLFGSADDKIQMLAQRYALIYQRVTRHELFRPSNVHTSTTSRGGPLKITPIESLLGKKQSNDKHTMVLLLGLLLQLEEGAYYLEDMTGQVRISFADHIVTPQDAAHYLTEQAILLVEGYYHDGLFHILRLGQPLQETRSAASKHISQQVSHPLYSMNRAAADGHVMLNDSTNVSFILLQDLYMDQPRVVQQFEGLLSTLETKYHNPSNSSPAVPVFILMGNFISAVSVVQATPSTGVQALKAALDELLTTIGKFPFLSQKGHFVIVPSPKDSLFHQHMLPLPAFLKSMRPTLTHTIPHLHYTTNPCRIRYNNNIQEMVIFRYDLLHLFQQHQLRLPQDKTKKDPPSSRIFKTILDQGHLLPLPSIPLYWNASHSLGLYPLPSCLVLAGNHSNTAASSHQGSYDNYWDCDVIQTVSFDTGGYTIYRPTLNETDEELLDQIPRAPDEEDPNAAAVVEFGRIG